MLGLNQFGTMKKNLIYFSYFSNWKTKHFHQRMTGWLNIGEIQHRVSFVHLEWTHLVLQAAFCRTLHFVSCICAQTFNFK